PLHPIRAEYRSDTLIPSRFPIPGHLSSHAAAPTDTQRYRVARSSVRRRWEMQYPDRPDSKTFRQRRDDEEPSLWPLKRLYPEYRVSPNGEPTAFLLLFLCNCRQIYRP